MKVKVERTTKKAAITKATAPEDSKIPKPGDPEEVEMEEEEEEEEELKDSGEEELDELKEAQQLAEQLSGQMDFLTTDLTATTKLATPAATPTTAAVRNLIAGGRRKWHMPANGIGKRARPLVGHWNWSTSGAGWSVAKNALATERFTRPAILVGITFVCDASSDEEFQEEVQHRARTFHNQRQGGVQEHELGLEQGLGQGQAQAKWQKRSVKSRLHLPQFAMALKMG
ncbi:uncharacterized protein Dana_GF23374 [Drosophila ananassae]|uniref:Uncharacterized protein n=1 Tax=Drosophila ananassae TaxID=7217 RepID=A0A0P9A340_DROAN|nr:uncharacterized protein Dana_GF23374 [Drosophila ananassae]